MKLSSLLVSLFVVGASANAESNKIIFKVNPHQRMDTFSFMGSRQIEALVPEIGLYAVTLTPTAARSVGARGAAAVLRQKSGVIYAQENHRVTRRADVGSLSTPNDKNFNQQWDLLKDSNNWGIDAVNAWTSFGTGGIDPHGSDIVSAVVDGGVDITHPDLVDNIWVNKAEIPNNNIDDDNNGYVDDINGWNAFSDNGTIESDMHGTHVAGTIGMKGNNNIFGAGINWNVKLMAINGASGDTATVLKAYGYVLKQKQLWLQSGGKLGANVVSTNASFGVDYGDCKSQEYAAWNDIYNEMGKVGILSVAATANMTIDVDKVGDVPTGCTSDHLIAVTNTQKTGKKHGSAAYGLTMIDLAAPGTNTYSTTPNSGFQSLTGTSMASPHVAGAVAYLHSVASKKFSDEYYANPATASLAMKQMIIDSVTPTDELKGKTVSGGILNLNSAAQLIHAH